MITAGIDLSSQAAGTGACAIDWSEHPARVIGLSVGVHDEEIDHLIRTVDKVGIDVPLGWPLAFVEAVARHSHDGSWPAGYSHADTSAVRYRRTDVWAWRLLGASPPLSVSSDRIALPAMRAAALLSRLPERVALDGSGVVVEVYPAAALRRWGFSSRGYKGKANDDARHALVDKFLSKTAAWLGVGDVEAELCLSSDDAFDALVAALVARAAALGQVEPIPPDDRTSALREGWIAVPTEGSLGLLMAP